MDNKWSCSVCRHDKYNITSNSVSNWAPHEYYCEKCTVRFFDPKKFNADKLPKAIPDEILRAVELLRSKDDEESRNKVIEIVTKYRSENK